MWLRRLNLRDWLVAGLVVMFTLPTSIGLLTSAAPWVAAVGGVCVAVLIVLLFGRRVRPRASFLTSCVTLLVLVTLPSLPDGTPVVFLPVSLIYLLVLHAEVAQAGRWRLPLAVSAAGLGLVLLRVASAVPDPLDWDAFWAFVPIAFALVLGSAALGVRDWESRQAQEQRLADAVARERALMAQEVHDVVAHTLAVMVAQSDAALLVADRDPRRARELVSNSVQAGREAMSQMRGAVRLLRAGCPPETAPVSSLGDLDRLVEAIRSPEIKVDLTVDGDTDRVDSETARAAYRIVQESLTNAVKHGSRPVRCQVLVHVDDRGVRVRIRDDGPGIRHDPDVAGGFGLAGMRERARSLGGRLDISSDRSGTEVSAWLPTG